MTKIPQASDPTTKFDLVYDAWNRLVEVKNHSGTTVTTNEYDGLNRRIVRDETGGNGKKTHYYYNSKWQVLEERIEVGGVIDPDPLAQYLYHPHYVDSIAMRRYDANTDGLNIEEHFYLQDANFNVTAITDDTGAVVERYSYTPYGEVTVLDSSFVLQNSSLISNEIQYTGRRLDPETGLQLNRNRFYASHLGRWVNRDPIGYDGGTNLYGYVNSNPLAWVDSSGNLGGIGIGIAIGIGIWLGSQSGCNEKPPALQPNCPPGCTPIAPNCNCHQDTFQSKDKDLGYDATQEKQGPAIEAELSNCQKVKCGSGSDNTAVLVIHVVVNGIKYPEFLTHSSRKTKCGWNHVGYATEKSGTGCCCKELDPKGNVSDGFEDSYIDAINLGPIKIDKENVTLEWRCYKCP